MIPNFNSLYRELLARKLAHLAATAQTILT
jgi:hypothetical protein